MKGINEKINSLEQSIKLKLGQDTNKIKNDERLMYCIPYNSLPITSPSAANEVAVCVENVILAVKEKIIDSYGNSAKIFEIYTQNGVLIGQSSENGRMTFDREILEEYIQYQIKAIKEAGLEPAGFEESGKIESIFEMLGREIVVLNEQEKEKVDLSGERRGALTEISKRHSSNGIEAERDESDELNPNNVGQVDLIKKQLEMQNDIEVYKMTKIDSHDTAFWENNPDIKTRNAYAVLTKSGELQILGENNGKFEPVNGFKNSSRESGRTTIIRNDELSLKDEERNTYGAIYSTRNSNMRYTIEIDGYGDIHFIEQIKHRGGNLEESDKYISREVASSSTIMKNRNLEGNDSSKNITQRTFNRNSSNRDASDYAYSNGKGGTISMSNNLKKHRDYNFESLASDENQRYTEALNDVYEELKNRNIDLTSQEKEDMEASLRSYMKEAQEVFCDDDVSKFVDGIEENRANKAEKNKTSTVDRNRLDEAYENRFGRR